MGQVITLYFPVLSLWEISRLIKQKQGNRYWLHKEGADIAVKARGSLGGVKADDAR